MVLLSLLACTPAVVPISTDTTELPADSAAPVDTSADEPPEHIEGLGEVDDLPGDCADFYSPDLLPTFALELTQSEWAGLQSDCSSGQQSYRPAQFSYDGETVDAMVRLKGNWSWSCEKLQFVISFNETDPDGRFHGVRKLVLDAPWYDHTLLHERLAFPLFAARDLPYSCANNARLEINGEYYGLYANLERIDREYLERHFDEPDGNLYQGGTELKTNEDEADTSDIEALGEAQTADEYAALIDLDQAVREWAMEAMIPAMDNYWAGVEINYYLYSHPSRGFLYLPYDLDISFGDAAYTGGSLIWPDAATVDPITYQHYGWLKEPLVVTVLSDPEWCARFVEELEGARSVYEPEALVEQVDAWSAQIGDALAEDPRRTFSSSDTELALGRLRSFFSERADAVDGWLAEGGHCPPQW